MVDAPATIKEVHGETSTHRNGATTPSPCMRRKDRAYSVARNSVFRVFNVSCPRHLVGLMAGIPYRTRPFLSCASWIFILIFKCIHGRWIGRMTGSTNQHEQSSNWWYRGIGNTLISSNQNLTQFDLFYHHHFLIYLFIDDTFIFKVRRQSFGLSFMSRSVCHYVRKKLCFIGWDVAQFMCHDQLYVLSTANRVKRWKQ